MKNKLLVKGGRLIDPAGGYHGEVQDILIEDGYFTRIGPALVQDDQTAVLKLDGQYVSPGFIDAHAHVYTAVSLGVDADEVGVKTGTTTVVDAGSAGPANIEDFIERDIKRCKTRIFSAMHYAKTGLLNPPEADREDKYDLEMAARAYQKYRSHIVGIKARASKSCVGDLGIISIRAGKKLAKELAIPLIVHIGNMPPTVEAVLELMEAGDIITHAFHGKANNLFADGQMKPETRQARERGVLFDIGHGKESYNFNTGKIAMELGFYPDMISTDIHGLNYQGPVYSLSVTMDKMLAMGFELKDCIEKVTTNPAKYLHLDKLGSIRTGYHGDLTIFNLQDGAYQFTDSDGNHLDGHQSIQVDYTVIAGEVVDNRSKEEKL